MRAPRAHDTGLNKFRNWHGNVSQEVRRIVDVWNAQPDRHTLPGYNRTTRTLQLLIGESVDAGEEIRALGGAWSFSPVAATNGTLLNTKPLNYKFSIPESAVMAGYEGKRDNLYFVQAGNSIAELNWYLFDRGKSLPTSGASNGQTIAGALSTGTHGSAIDFGAIPEFVKAIHLVVSPARHVWLEPASNPVVRNSRLPNRLEAEVIRDDDLFHAALVSFGSCGIIHGVVIQADDRFFLNMFRTKLKRTPGLRRFMEDLDFTAFKAPGAEPGVRPHHLSAVINPFDPDQVYMTAMYRHRTMPPGSRLPDPPSGVTPGDDALGLIAVLTDRFDVAPFLMRRILDSELHNIENVAGTPGQIFRDTTTRGRAASSAVGIPLSEVNKVIDLFLETHGATEAPALIGIRYVKSTLATLGFTSFDDRTAIVEIDGPDSERVRDMHKQAWNALRSKEIPHRFHWGKQHELTADQFRIAYGDARVESWISSRQELLESEGRNAFLNDTVRHILV
ncbi:FAD-binding protein [Candidatus Palauibacter soopunensis]|uniref:FAD-binding protein n=1 Tax=Candidatus Palauibacter soopunensis TaxID=3056739 RepID=UPI00238E6BB3|nr:FAD-binding protein [Candidatus Palauibacter soopunensis]MDE2878623.1 FAD-binding protein [Candidatus Palauibacter soopunensis]